MHPGPLLATPPTSRGRRPNLPGLRVVVKRPEEGLGARGLVSTDQLHARLIVEKQVQPLGCRQRRAVGRGHPGQPCVWRLAGAWVPHPQQQARHLQGLPQLVQIPGEYLVGAQGRRSVVLVVFGFADVPEVEGVLLRLRVVVPQLADPCGAPVVFDLSERVLVVFGSGDPMVAASTDNARPIGLILATARARPRCRFRSTSTTRRGCPSLSGYRKHRERQKRARSRPWRWHLGR